MSTLPFSQIREEKVEWLVPSMLPLGCVSLLVGRGGQGKSTFCGHLAAKLSRGEPAFPGDRPTEPANTLFISAEDSLSHVLVPRIRVAGGDLTRIHGWDLDARGLTLPDDVDDLEDAILRIGARLVVIDPLSAFLNSRIDSHKDAGVRAALRPLHVLAERNQVALLGVMHLNKSAGGSVDVRISGSTAWSNAGRASLVFGLPPDVEVGSPRRIVTVGKSNYGPDGIGHELTLRVPDGEEHPVIGYVAPTTIRAEDVLNTSADDDERSAAADCLDWLQAELHSGERAARDVQAAAKDAGYTAKVLRRARERLQIKPRKDGYSGRWMWRLPDGQGAQDAQDAHRALSGKAGTLGTLPPDEDELSRWNALANGAGR